MTALEHSVLGIAMYALGLLIGWIARDIRAHNDSLADEKDPPVKWPEPTGEGGRLVVMSDPYRDNF